MEMTNKSAHRNYFLYGLLAITVGLTVWMATQKQEEENPNDLLADSGARVANRQPVFLPKDKRQGPHDATIPAWPSYQRHRSSHEIKDLFPVHSWYVPPPVKKVPPPPPPVPVAPPVPFVYVGKLEEKPGEPAFFLLSGNRLYTLKKGEKVGEEWRLDTEVDQMLTFTYLPLGLPQTLSKMVRANTVVPPTEIQNNF